MKFGRITLDQAEDAILAHTVQMPGGAIKKGHRLNQADIARLRDHGHDTIIAARLQPSDITEDAAAARIARAIAGPNLRLAEPFTGRVNIFATTDGLATIDAAPLIAINQIDEGLTIATLGPHERVTAGQMVATVKIIPFSLPAHVVETAEQAISGSPEPLIAVAAFTPHNAHLILTELPGSKPSVIEKRRQALLKRLEAAGSTLSATEIVPHDEQAVAAAIDRAGKTGADPILVFGASAIVDRKDVIPAGIEASGGTVRHLGMPVDPGNLLLLGDRGGRTVIGVPSCASSPKINGLDWVLERTLANLAISDADIAAMSVGGLLMEIQSRPQPREGSGPTGKRHTPRIAAVVLAAGRSTRMGTNNKLLEKLDGRSLVSHAVDAARQSRAGHIVVVTGHEADAVRTELDGTAVNFTHNPGYAEGLATSLATGLAALPNGIDGAVVLLGDMPGVDAKIIDKLIAAFAPDDHRGICVPTTGGQRGNPVLWAHRYFAEMKNLKGDIGAKALLGVHAEDVAEVAIDSDAILTDIDTPEALAIARSSP